MLFHVGLALLCTLHLASAGASVNPHFYPYGADEGDTFLEIADDSYSDPIPLSPSLVFFESTYAQIWVSHLIFLYMHRNSSIHFIYHIMKCCSKYHKEIIIIVYDIPSMLSRYYLNQKYVNIIGSFNMSMLASLV